MNPNENLKNVESDMERALVDAKAAGASGIEDPRASIERARAAAENAKDFLAERLDTLDRLIEEKEPELISRHVALKELDKEILRKWNEKPRLVTSRSEAETSIKNFKSEQERKTDFWSFLTIALFAFEFCFGYWIFKSFVLPDPGLGNQITSVMVGGMVLAVGFFLKILPDSTESLEKYQKWKLFLTVASGTSAVVFIVLLAYMRQVIGTESLPDLATGELVVSGSTISERIVDFAFQMSLLLTLIFCAGFFSHWKKKYPRALLKARHDEGMDLRSWYENDAYKFGQKETSLKELADEIEAMKAAKSSLREKLKYLSSGKIANIMREACIAFYEGANSPPLTEAKRRAAANARTFLDSSTAKKGTAYVVHQN